MSQVCVCLGGKAVKPRDRESGQGKEDNKRLWKKRSKREGRGLRFWMGKEDNEGLW